MRVNVEGTKYTICSDDSGKVWIERHGEMWIPPQVQGAKLWIAVAFELACLRQIAKAAVALVEHADTGAEPFGHIGGLADLFKRLEGYTDFRRNLDDPGDL